MTDQSGYRTERDSMGEVQVPADALYGAQTQRAVDNFPISGLRMPPDFIHALGRIKACAARANAELGQLEPAIAEAIAAAAETVAAGAHDDQFPIDVFQTGSGTSTNMNANEVIARLAGARAGTRIHPNDHVNRGQSSNDVIPTAIHVSARLAVEQRLLPALEHLATTIEDKARSLAGIVKTGRTHLMDAMPVSFAQELGGWAQQIRTSRLRIGDTLPRLERLAQGGTAVGTGINAHPDFAGRFCARLAADTGIPFHPAEDFFEALSCQDTAVELSGQLRGAAGALLKIANDLRWMNSGPLTGLGEISLPALQPGSSIMPGKVNPVISEAVIMAAAQITGNDATIACGGQWGSFQLNTMLPVIALNLLQSIELLASSARVLADKAVADFTVNAEHIRAALERNPVLVTALNERIGYEKGAAIAKRAYAEGRAVKEVAREMTDLSEAELNELLDPAQLIRPQQ
ncbi:MAG TPA: class II fumarate hydratase [Thiohalobacter sp.]|nr:class II fumarate hydratase [Thiohalobacter sp.]